MAAFCNSPGLPASSGAFAIGAGAGCVFDGAAPGIDGFAMRVLGEAERGAAVEAAGSGSGDEVALSVLGPDVPTTGLTVSPPLRSKPRATRRVLFACSTLMGLVKTKLAPIRNAFATPD